MFDIRRIKNCQEICASNPQTRRNPRCNPGLLQGTQILAFTAQRPGRAMWHCRRASKTYWVTTTWVVTLARWAISITSCYLNPHLDLVTIRASVVHLDLLSQNPPFFLFFFFIKPIFLIKILTQYVGGRKTCFELQSTLYFTQYAA